MNKVAIKLSIGLENTLMQIRRLHLDTPATLCRKYNLDYSKVPVLDEKDMKEQFVHGWGPGGQAVNKTLNCVVLVHQSLGMIFVTFMKKFCRFSVDSWINYRNYCEVP